MIIPTESQLDILFETLNAITKENILKDSKVIMTLYKEAIKEWLASIP